jgi:VWFA-related protein
MRTVLAFTICCLLALSARAETWSRDLDAALVQSAQEQKLVLLHLRGACGRKCNEPLDKLLADAGKYPAIAEAFQHFILVRVEELGPSPAVKKVLAQRPRKPSLLIVDPEGQMIQPRRTFATANELIDFLSQLRVQSGFILRAAALRQAGDLGQAQLTLGHAFLHLQAFENALNLFQSAAAEFRKGGKREEEEFARTYSYYAEYFFQFSERNYAKANDAMVALLRIAEFSSNRANTAEAWMAIGGIRMTGHDTAGATRAYRRAWELAAPGSPTRTNAQHELEGLGDTWAAAQHDASSAQATVRVIAPPRSTISGKAEFIANTSGAVARVDFFVDDVKAATAARAPFRARIDVGELPRLRTVKAVAYDGAGKVVGESAVSINDRVDAFHVSILSPVAEQIEGNVTVEADAQAPEGRKVTSVAVYWNEAKLVTFDARPFRIDFAVPPGFGYLRAVATLDDGRTAEDTRVYNAGAVSATVEVHAVGLSATVVDADGKRVEGLSAKDFAAKDEGKPVPVTDRAFSDEPATIALAIDASRSMRTSLLDLFDAATNFVDTVVSPRSRLFLVAFDSTPRVIHPPSDDAKSLRASILQLNPTGSTAAIDAITFSLQQFRGIGGRRALVVITDGRDGPNSQSVEACERMSMQIGVPIYVIVPRVYAGSLFGNALAGIAEKSGGLTFFSAERRELPSIFAKIRDEVMGQYLLSIAGRPGNGEWRRLEVQVPGRKDVKVRTIGGYYAR